MNTSGLFTVIEGLDASGKDTQSRRLALNLGAERVSFPTYEDHPEAAPLGRIIAEHLKGRWAAEPAVDQPATAVEVAHLDAQVFQALMLANKCELAPLITATLLSGRSVVADRYWPSAYAYGKADGLDGDWLVAIHRTLPQAGLHILLDIDYEQSLQRRPDRRDRYEKKGEAFFATLADNYRELWQLGHDTLPGAWVIVDGRKPADEVADAIAAAVAGVD